MKINIKYHAKMLFLIIIKQFRIQIRHFTLLYKENEAYY